jgi:hypothetical protein
MVEGRHQHASKKSKTRSLFKRGEFSCAEMTIEQLEEEINVGIKAELEIIFATAVPIEPSAPPESLLTLAASGTSTFAAPVVTNATSVTTSGTAPPTSIVQVVIPPAPTTPGNSLPPHVPAGGHWVEVQRIGPAT